HVAKYRDWCRGSRDRGGSFCDRRRRDVAKGAIHSDPGSNAARRKRVLGMRSRVLRKPLLRAGFRPTLRVFRSLQAQSLCGGFSSYADHLYENFRPYPAIERSQLRARLIDLATTSLSGEDSMPIPDRDEYPDLVTVLSVAYLRIYRFREYLDELLPAGGGRFW